MDGHGYCLKTIKKECLVEKAKKKPKTNNKKKKRRLKKKGQKKDPEDLELPLYILKRVVYKSICDRTKNLVTMYREHEQKIKESQTNSSQLN